MTQPTVVTDADILEGILAGTTSLIAGVPAESGDARTPCPEFDVAVLINHLVGFMRRFDAVLTMGQSADDSAAYVAGDDPTAEYADAAASAVAAWRAKDPNDSVVLTVGPMPRWQVYCVMLVETTVHGWDLAKATDQPLLFTEEQAIAALEASRLVVRPEYRGPDSNFGAEVAVSPDARTLDRLVAFTGRNPGWPR